MKLNQYHCLLCSFIAFVIGWLLSKYYYENKEHYSTQYRVWDANGIAGGQTLAHQGNNNYERVGRFGGVSADGSKAGGCRYGYIQGHSNSAGRGCCVVKDNSNIKGKCCREVNENGQCVSWTN